MHPEGSILNLSRISFYSIVFTLSFASMSYEYVLSHVLSILFGDLVVNYLLTTSLFIFFMGVGAWFYEVKLNKMMLFKLEYFLSFISLFIIIIPVYFFSISENLSFIALIFFIILIALLTGIELPCLLKLGYGHHETLCLDYIGMALAGVSFAYFLLPVMGLQLLSISVGAINFCMAIYIQYKLRKDKKLFFLFLIPVIGICLSSKFTAIIERGYIGY